MLYLGLSLLKRLLFYFNVLKQILRGGAFVIFELKFLWEEIIKEIQRNKEVVLHLADVAFCFFKQMLSRRIT